MILYPNRERWFLNIRSRNNRIIISDSLFFNFNRCSYFYFYGRMIFKPLLLGEINISRKRFTEEATISESSPYLVLNLRKISVSIKDLTQSNLGVIPDSLPSSRSQSSELRLILSNKSHLNSIVFIIKEPAQEVSSMVRLFSESRA